MKLLMSKFTMAVFCMLFRKDVKNMAVVYVTLIIKGAKTIDDVPVVIRPEVEILLGDLEVNV